MKTKKQFKSIVFLILALVFVTCALSGCADDETPPAVDYSQKNAYEVAVTEDEQGVYYEPQGVKAAYGVVVYVGSFLDPDCYDYLGRAFAAEGYVVAVPKFNANCAYYDYRENEPVFEKYPDVSFFVAGHSQGGGAAVKRGEQGSERVCGVILYTPLCYNEDTLENSALPVLYVDATGDGILTRDMKRDAKHRLPSHAETVVIDGGNHMGFAGFDSVFLTDGELLVSLSDMQSQVIGLTVDFMRACIA